MPPALGIAFSIEKAASNGRLEFGGMCWHIQRMKKSNPTALTVIAMSVVIGVGLVFARGGFADIPSSQIPLVIGGGLAGALFFVGVGYGITRIWDYFRSLLKRGGDVRQRNTTR
jgi:hypothetical protein